MVLRRYGCESLAWLHGIKILIGNMGRGSLVPAPGRSSRETAKRGEKEIVIATYPDFNFGITISCVQNWDKCRKGRVKASGLNNSAMDEEGGGGRGRGLAPVIYKTTCCSKLQRLSYRWMGGVCIRA